MAVNNVFEQFKRYFLVEKELNGKKEAVISLH